MPRIPSLADHLAPDSVSRLELAAQKRFEEAEALKAKNRLLAALYFYGYSVEMCLTAAYFRAVGFSPHVPINRDTRQRRMAQARQLRTGSGEPLMNSDPHPLVGWARFLHWQRAQSTPLSTQETQRLNEAIRNAGQVYKHWRPEIRYKVTDASPKQLNEARRAASWFIEQRGRL